MESTNRQANVLKVSRRIKPFIVVFGVFLFSLHTCLLTDIYAETAQLTIIHSNNINGHIFPCPT
jgi:hypothetical protein